MYRFLFALLIFLAVFFFATHYAESQELFMTLKQGRPFWVLAAVGFEVLFLLNRAGFYQAVYRVVGVEESWKRLVLLVSAGAFVSLVAPGGAVSGTALIVADAVKRGATLARAILINLVFYLCDYGAFVTVLLGAFGYLWAKGSLTAYEEIAATLLLLFVGGQVILIGAAVRWPKQLVNVVGSIVRSSESVIPPLKRRKAGEKAVSFVNSLVDAVKWLAVHPRNLLRVGLHAFLVEALSICVLGSVFMAFAGGVSPGTLIAGYAVGMLFLIVSITPSGVGVVEGAMAATFASLGVRPETAVVVTFVFRGITVWLPFLGGIVSFRVVGRN
ncbi:MAG: flippase-like domain-containing protein [Firmicutes bacterium]|nr:flippase-like domain-containing protein [Bacillota bacterium]